MFNQGKFSPLKREEVPVDSGIEVTPNEALEQIKKLWSVGITPILEGKVGCGKTSIARVAIQERALEEKGVEAVDSRIERPHDGSPTYTEMNFNLMEPEDIVYPNYTDKKGYTQKETIVDEFFVGADPSWGPPKLIHNTTLWEEIGKKEVMFPIFAQSVNERRLGSSLIIPEGVRFIATTNSSDSQAGAVDLTADAITRACILVVNMTHKDFLNHHAGELDPLIMACVKAHGDEWLFTQEFEEVGKPFACPRQVARLNDLFVADQIDLSKNGDRATVRGLIGIRATVELQALHNAMGRLGDIDAMIDDPVAHEDDINQFRNDNSHNGRQALCAMTAMLGKRVKTDPQSINKLFPFMKLFGEEAEVTFAHMALAVNKDIAKEPAYVRHMADHQDGFYF
jgi:hypothetical protein|tara:strand:- start:2663 stop:3853 length:1191 start_codon:yes stop_codon:yes gene_type:complete